MATEVSWTTNDAWTLGVVLAPTVFFMLFLGGVGYTQGIATNFFNQNCGKHVGIIGCCR
jgi:hypothetical protein